MVGWVSKYLYKVRCPNGHYIHNFSQDYYRPQPKDAGHVFKLSTCPQSGWVGGMGWALHTDPTIQ